MPPPRRESSIRSPLDRHRPPGRLCLLALLCAALSLATSCAATFNERAPATLSADLEDGFAAQDSTSAGQRVRAMGGTAPEENLFEATTRLRARSPVRFADDAASPGGQDDGGTNTGRADASPTPAPAPPARLMVYTAQLGLLVSKREDAREAFLTDVKRRGGYLEEQTGSSVVVRVPAIEFDACLDHVRGLGRVLDETIRAQDVTRQFRDLGIRIENAEETRKRLLALYEKANDPDDIRGILEHLHRITEELERYKGELRYLSEQIAFSKIGVDFQQNAPPAKSSGRRQSRFWWVNQIGLETVLSRF